MSDGGSKHGKISLDGESITVVYKKKELKKKRITYWSLRSWGYFLKVRMGDRINYKAKRNANENPGGSRKDGRWKGRNYPLVGIQVHNPKSS